jgi:hypothetical protein
MASISTPLRVVGALVALALVGSGLYGLVRPEPEHLVLEPNDRETAVRLGTLEADEAPIEVPPLPAIPTLPPDTSLARAHGSTASAAEAGDDLNAEMRLLSEARISLAEDPAEALALLEQHRERYPLGALREEREAYSILLLRRLDRAEDAERRLFDFRMDFPGSNFDAVLREESARVR